MAALLVGCCYLVGRFMSILNPYRGLPYLRLGMYEGRKYTLILFAIIVLFLILTIFRNYRVLKNRVAVTDERGVAIAEKATSGSSHWATAEEKENTFTIGNIKDTAEMVYGQQTDNGEKVYSFKKPKAGATGTKHILVVSKSGSGKSFNFVMPNILQAVKRGDSAIVVDPSGELYLHLGQYCRDNGYDVKLLNLANLEYSEYWNCLSECIDEETGRVSADRLREFAEIYMKNSTEVDGQNFWYECAQNLIETTIGYIAVRRESAIINNYIKLYERITGQSGSSFALRCNTSFVTFPWCEDTILTAAREKGMDLDVIKGIISEIKANAPKFNVREVYYALHNIKNVEKEFVSLPKYHPAYFAYTRYIVNPKDAVIDGAKQGAQTKFKIFDDYRLQEILSHDGIDFKTINKKKSIYFMAKPDTSNALKPIASLFFSFFFKDAQENYDLENQISTTENRKNACLPVMVMMDEFSSLGVVMGDEALFETTMSDCRKRDIYNCIVIQHISQLEATYGIYQHGILSNCQTTLCMGVSKADEKTKQHISRMTGIATAVKTSHTEHDGIFVNYPEDRRVNVSETTRYLMTPDEVADINNEVLVLRDGCYPFKARLFGINQHPAVKQNKCRDVSYFENIPSLSSRTAEMARNEKDDPESYIRDLIDSIGSQKQTARKPVKLPRKKQPQDSQSISDLVDVKF